MSAIKTFLNCSHLDKNIELQLVWNARKQLALKTQDGFGLDLSKIVTRIQAEICRVELSTAALNSRDYIKSVGTKIDLITEIEAAKGNFLFRQPELYDCTLQVKELWSLITRCFLNFLKFIEESPSECTIHGWIVIREELHIFEWMRSQLDKLKNEEELLMAWSIAWIRLKSTLNRTESLHTSKVIIDINNILEPQLRQFNLLVRQFFSQVGFEKVR